MIGGAEWAPSGLTLPRMTKVLVGADDIWVENDVRAALTDAGTELIAISDPRTAAATAIEHSPDVAVVDLQVGSMGGMALRALRSAMAGARFPR
jgi:DNA-binding response OmpR family regulator